MRCSDSISISGELYAAFRDHCSRHGVAMRTVLEQLLVDVPIEPPTTPTAVGISDRMVALLRNEAWSRRYRGKHASQSTVLDAAITRALDAAGAP